MLHWDGHKTRVDGGQVAIFLSHFCEHFLIVLSQLNPHKYVLLFMWFVIIGDHCESGWQLSCHNLERSVRRCVIFSVQNKSILLLLFLYWFFNDFALCWICRTTGLLTGLTEGRCRLSLQSYQPVVSTIAIRPLCWAHFCREGWKLIMWCPVGRGRELTKITCWNKYLQIPSSCTSIIKVSTELTKITRWNDRVSAIIWSGASLSSLNASRFHRRTRNYIICNHKHVMCSYGLVVATNP